MSKLVNQPNTDKTVLAEIRKTVKVTNIWNGVPVTSISKLVLSTTIVNQYGNDQICGVTHKNTMKTNRATMIADNATAAHELLIAGII